jgi:ATP-dependent Clp protease ATP-binding subunit ClpA
MNSHKEHLLGLEGYLRSRVIGQDDAIESISRALESSELDMNDRGPRPKGTFLFMGSRGIGKTASAKAFTEYLFGNDRLTMLFMNEMQSASNVADLVRAIRRAVETHPEGTTILCDEIEKAHRAIIDVFISLLDEGQITDADGSRISIGNCYVVLTSNLGASRWGQMQHTKYSVMERFGFEQARKVLKPELFNRLTETIVYRPLSQEVQIRILQEMLMAKLAFLQSRIEASSPPLSVDSKVHAYLLRKCFSQAEGARRLRQELDRRINVAATPWVGSSEAPHEGRFYVDSKADRLVLR